MSMVYFVHIVAGGLRLASGFALHAAKGATLHRKRGMVFVCTMLTMSVSAADCTARLPHFDT